MSALPLRADTLTGAIDVRFVPEADLTAFDKSGSNVVRCPGRRLLIHRSRPTIIVRPEAVLALLGRDHVDTTRYHGYAFAPTFRALRLCSFMLGDGLGTLERRPAFFATIIVGWHSPTPANTVGRKDFGARRIGEDYTKTARWRALWS